MSAAIRWHKSPFDRGVSLMDKLAPAARSFGRPLTRALFMVVRQILDHLRLPTAAPSFRAPRDPLDGLLRKRSYEPLFDHSPSPIRPAGKQAVAWRGLRRWSVPTTCPRIHRGHDFA